MLGNEVLDAMPVQLVVKTAQGWRERGIGLAPKKFVYRDRPCDPALLAQIPNADMLPVGYLTEVHPIALGFVRSPWSYYVSWYSFQSQRPRPNALFRCVSDEGTLDFKASVRNLAGSSLASDNVFSDGWAQQLTTVTGDVSAGYVASLVVPVG